jgi:hypothetical protein
VSESDELVAAIRAGVPYLRDVRQLPLCAILFEEAANEIDRLRAELAEYRNLPVALVHQTERARRAESAIARVSALCANWAVQGHGQGKLTRAMAANIFRAALDGGTE